MAKPEEVDRGGSCRGLGAVVLGVVVLSLVALTVCVFCLDARRRQQMTDMSDQLTALRKIVEDMQRQLDRQEDRINSSIQIRNGARSNPSEEVYEQEYEYDEEESSYEDEYEEEDESVNKSPVKRTVKSAVKKNKTENVGKDSALKVSSTRLRREVRTGDHGDVPVKDERYVPSDPYLNRILNYKSKSEGLRVYASYFGNPQSNIGYQSRIHPYMNRVTESQVYPDGSDHSTRSYPDGSDHSTRSYPDGSDHSTRSYPDRSDHSTMSYPDRSEHSPRIYYQTGYQEQIRPEESTIRLRHQHQHRTRNSELETFSGEESAPSHRDPKEVLYSTLAAQFVGSAYGHGLLHHNLFKDWRPSEWVSYFNLEQYFPLEDGRVVVKQPGLYLVYAQVYYAGSHERCGFHIKHNGTAVAQCMTMTTGTDHKYRDKRNTCFTAIILHLNQNDRLWLSEVEGNRNTSFKSHHSFFGLIQLRSA